MSEGTETKTYTAHYREGISAADPTIPFRLVGTYEYDNALSLLEPLIASSIPEQIEVYNRFLEDRPEFTFYNGASLLDDRALAGMDLKKDAVRVRFDDEFKKKGLAWMMALAKVELGATASAYGQTKTPFALYPATQFDLVPFLEVMFDDIATHIKALGSDQDFKQVLKSHRIADTWTVAYLRRVKLIRDMIQVLKGTGDPGLLARLAPYDQELTRYSNRLIDNIQLYEIDQVSQHTDTADVSAGYRESSDEAECKDLISAIRSAGK